MKTLKKLTGIGLLYALFTLTPNASAIVFDEALDGDLSDTPTDPTAIALDNGVNSISGNTIVGDFDLFVISIDAGQVLSSVILADFMSTNDLGFIGLQNSSTWTEGLGGAIDPANLLGWSHFGPGNGTVGTDVLDDIGVGFGATGFLPPLGTSDYVFLVQQTGPELINYQFDLTVTDLTVPEPTTLWLLMIGLLGSIGMGYSKVLSPFKRHVHIRQSPRFD